MLAPFVNRPGVLFHFSFSRALPDLRMPSDRSPLGSPCGQLGENAWCSGGEGKIGAALVSVLSGRFFGGMLGARCPRSSVDRALACGARGRAFKSRRGRCKPLPAEAALPFLARMPLDRSTRRNMATASPQPKQAMRCPLPIHCLCLIAPFSAGWPTPAPETPPAPSRRLTGVEQPYVDSAPGAPAHGRAFAQQSRLT
jgi:hypothetical protein